MSRRIRSMVDEIFSEMRMSAENLALRDELMDNALSRYEDAVAQGKGEEEALREVAESLEDVQGLLDEMNRMDAAAQQKDETQEEEAQEDRHIDLSGALGKAFSALEDFSQAVVPEAKKFAKEVDGATGGMLSRLGRAAKKGMRDAQKAAGAAIDRLSGEKGELIIDFDARKDEEKSVDVAPCEAEQEICAASADAAADEEAPIIKENGEIDEELLSRAVEEAVREAEKAQQGDEAQ